MAEHVANSAGGPDAGAIHGSRRRITAGSFRALTARLRGEAPPPQEAAEPVQPVAPPCQSPAVAIGFHAGGEGVSAPPAIELPTIAPLDPPRRPEPAQATPPEPPAVVPELPTAIEEALEPAQAEAEERTALPPLAPEASAAVAPERSAAEEAPSEAVAEAAAPMMEPPAAADVSVAPEQAAAEPAASVAEPASPPVVQSAAHAASEAGEKQKPATTDLLADAMMRTVREAVYARPNAIERAAFLRDVAALMEEEKGEEQIITAAQSVSPIAAMIEAARKAASSSPPASPALASSAAMGSATAPAVPERQRQADSPTSFKPAARGPALAAPRLDETPEADLGSGDLALSLLDMMSAGAGSGLPHERALAADTLLRLVPRVPVKQLVAIVERLAIMESPPALLVAKLIRDPRAEVVAPLLERCMHITDQDLTAAAIEGDAGKRRMIARRRTISPVLSDQLIEGGDTSVLLTLIRNPGASFSHEAFYNLADEASRHQALLAPLATRADLPVPVAFELFWFLPHELRRFIFSRFLTDSETLNRILKITLGGSGSASEKFPPRARVKEAIAHATEGDLDTAATILAEAGGIDRATAARVLGDGEGEPLTVALKAMGYPRAGFLPAIEKLRTSASGTLRADRNITELESIFDSLSFNKARILLTYWDWFVTKSGPYAPHN